MKCWMLNSTQVIMMHVIHLGTKGRAIFLLKKSANLTFERKERKTFALLNLSDSSNEEEKKEEEE